ncbi:MAG: hypothetical protein AB8H80_06435 [Planctomycetota bacterium]
MRFLPCLLATAAVATAQSPLTTTFAGGNGQSGNMFDVVATNAAGVTVRSFDVNLSVGTHDLEVYTLPSGSPYLADVNNAAAWTLVGSAAGVVSAGAGVATTLPICVETFVPAGTTQAFYVTISTTGIMNYTNGVTTGALFASNADLEFYEGAGLAYPFTANFNPRVWNGNIIYDVGNTVGAGCSFPTVEEYGIGCGDVASASFYEELDPVSMDLSGTILTGINTGAGYLIQSAPGAGGIAPGVSAVSIPLGDDDAQPAGTLGIEVGSNCWIALGTGNSLGFTPAVAEMLNNPATGVYSWTDLEPNATGSGLVFYEEDVATGDVTVTYDGVFGWGTTDPNTVQFKYNVNTGDFSIEWGILSLTNPENWLMGYSPAGASNDPGATDLSMTGTMPLITAAADSGPLALSSSTAVIGSNWDLTTSLIDAVSPIAITFIGDRSPVGVPLPVIGLDAPGCEANLATVLGSLTGVSAAGSTTVTVPVPNNAALIGALLSGQSLCLTLQNAANVLTSNGVEVSIGN